MFFIIIFTELKYTYIYFREVEMTMKNVASCNNLALVLGMYNFAVWVETALVGELPVYQTGHNTLLHAGLQLILRQKNLSCSARVHNWIRPERRNYVLNSTCIEIGTKQFWTRTKLFWWNEQKVNQIPWCYILSVKFLDQD